MTENNQTQLGNTLWKIADELRGAMNADQFRDYMLSFLFLRYLSDNYEAAAKKELGKDYPVDNPFIIVQKTELELEIEKKFRSQQGNKDSDLIIEKTKNIPISPLGKWYFENPDDIKEFEKQMRRKVHYVIEPDFLWNSIAELAKTQSKELLRTLQDGFKYIENQSFESTFQGLFSEINLDSDKLGKNYEERNKKLCTIIQKIAEGINSFDKNIDWSQNGSSSYAL
jgi:type I restriction enzyme M protein